jgi:tetratricopeptide (TPR) repeat protein
MELSELKNKLATALSESDIENLGRLSEEAMQLYPNEGFGYYYFGEKLLNEAALDMPAVEWAFAKASFLEQDNINYLKKYAQSLEDLLKFEEAGNVFASIYNINPDDQEALYGLGKYELSDERKNYSNAIYYFSKIENPSAAVYHGLALAYMGLEESDNALGMIDYALSLEFDIEAAITKFKSLKRISNLFWFLLFIKKFLKQSQIILALFMNMLSRLTGQRNLKKLIAPLKKPFRFYLMIIPSISQFKAHLLKIVWKLDTIRRLPIY